MHKNIFLIGPMGAGKTSVGRELAKLLGSGFVDTDDLLELRMQQSMRDIIATHGEPFFRNVESAVLAEGSSLGCGIIATGGGCILLEQNRQLLQNAGHVCYLFASPEQQLLRLANCTERGLLPRKAGQRMVFFKQMAALRYTLYEAAATVKVNTDGYNVTQVVQQILESLGQAKDGYTEYGR